MEGLALLLWRYQAHATPLDCCKSISTRALSWPCALLTLLRCIACSTKRWRAFASGAAAGPTLLLTGPKARHTSLAIYILLRGLALMIR